MIMEITSIAELKRMLSAYLRIVRAGGEVVVTDRGRPVAKLVPLGDGPLGADARVDDLIRRGLARAPSSELPDDLWKLPRPADPEGRALRALLEERAEGR